MVYGQGSKKNEGRSLGKIKIIFDLVGISLKIFCKANTEEKPTIYNL